MWRLFNKMLGWHYVFITDCRDHHIVRVRKNTNGELMGGFMSRKIFISKDGTIEGGYNITSWRPLTFQSEDH